MSTNNNPCIAIIFDDLTEFFVMRPAIDQLKKQNIPIDIIVPHDSGYNGLAKHTLKTIKDLGYSPQKDISKTKTYQIIFTPYFLDIVNRANFHYHFQYTYGAISAKPNPTYAPNYRINYDAIFSFNTYDTDFLGAYGAKVYTIPYWRYHNFKRHTSKKNAKPNLLILPTFGTDTSCIEHLAISTINEIKKHYHVIAKSHHATHFGPQARDAFEKLKNLADEFYDSDTPIDQLLSQADLVLSDNSGAIFESICAGVPTALFAQNLDSRHFEKIHTPQYEFAQQNFLPYTNKSNQILPMLQSIQKYAKKQATLKNQLFLDIPNNPTKPFIDIIKNYLARDPDQDKRKILHNSLSREWRTTKTRIAELEQQLSSQNEQLDKLTNISEQHLQAIRDLRSSTSWKITKPLRQIKFIKRKEQNGK